MGLAGPFDKYGQQLYPLSLKIMKQRTYCYYHFQWLSFGWGLIGLAINLSDLGQVMTLPSMDMIPLSPHLKQNILWCNICYMQKRKESSALQLAKQMYPVATWCYILLSSTLSFALNNNDLKNFEEIWHKDKLDFIENNEAKNLLLLSFSVVIFWLRADWLSHQSEWFGLSYDPTLYG